MTRYFIADAAGDNVYGWDDDGLELPIGHRDRLSWATREEAEAALVMAECEIDGAGPMHIEEEKEKTESTKSFKVEVTITEEMIEEFLKVVKERGGPVPDGEDIKNFFKEDVSDIYEAGWYAGIEDAVDNFFDIPGQEK